MNSEAIRQTQQTLTIEKVTPDLVTQVANVHLQAFQGYLNAELGFSYAYKFIKWFTLFENRIALYAKQPNNEIIGYVLGAQLEYSYALNRYIFLTALYSVLTHFWLIIDPKYFNTLVSRLGLKPTRVNSSPILPKPTMSLVGIGVLPTARRKTVGERLMQAFEETAYEMQVNSLRLSVYAENLAARHLYEKSGWMTNPDSISPSGALYYFKYLRR